MQRTFDFVNVTGSPDSKATDYRRNVHILAMRAYRRNQRVRRVKEENYARFTETSLRMSAQLIVSKCLRSVERVEDAHNSPETYAGSLPPSLPSLPGFDEDDSLEEGPTPSRVIENASDDGFDDSLGDISAPIHSTPTTSSHMHTTTIHAPPSAGSTARFAQSIASRSSKSSIGPTVLKSQKDSFDITDIPSLSAIPRENTTFSRTYGREKSSLHDPEIYLPPLDDDVGGDQEYSISDALQSVSRSGTPPRGK